MRSTGDARRARLTVVAQVDRKGRWSPRPGITAKSRALQAPREPGSGLGFTALDDLTAAPDVVGPVVQPHRGRTCRDLRPTAGTSMGALRPRFDAQVSARDVRVVEPLAEPVRQLLPVVLSVTHASTIGSSGPARREDGGGGVRWRATTPRPEHLTMRNAVPSRWPHIRRAHGQGAGGIQRSRRGQNARCRRRSRLV
jgi:hypothetical protein